MIYVTRKSQIKDLKLKCLLKVTIEKQNEKICVCEDCAEKLFGIKSTKTRLKEITDMLRATTVTVKNRE